MSSCDTGDEAVSGEPPEEPSPLVMTNTNDHPSQSQPYVLPQPPNIYAMNQQRPQQQQQQQRRNHKNRRSGQQRGRYNDSVSDHRVVPDRTFGGGHQNSSNNNNNINDPTILHSQPQQQQPTHIVATRTTSNFDGTTIINDMDESQCTVPVVTTTTTNAPPWKEMTLGNQNEQQQQQQRSTQSSSSMFVSGRSSFLQPTTQQSHGNDRRKQFDATTPTLIDEDDGITRGEEEDEDTEMLQLQRSFDRGSSITVDGDGEIIRRTPGASMYKSNLLGDNTTTTPTTTQRIDDVDDVNTSISMASVRRTPGASAMHRSGPPPGMGTISAVASVSATDETESAAAAAPSLGISGAVTAPGMGTTVEGIATSLASSGRIVDEERLTGNAEGLDFGLGLHTSLDSSGDFSSSPGRGQKQQTNMTWGSFQSPIDLSHDDIVSKQQVAVDASGSPSRRPESRSLYTFETWATAKGPDPESGRTNTGTFSPNILRLTEALGNLLQEDEDDAYALEIPNAFLDVNTAPNVSSSSDFDWTGSYVFDSEYRRKPAVPTRSAVGAEKNTRRRAATGDSHDQTLQHSQQSDTVAVSMQNTYQPKPRRNEAFAFGRPSSQATQTDDRESPQLLIFGGAFAPPASNLHAGGFMRPVASLHGQDVMLDGTEIRNETTLPRQHQDVHRPQYESMMGYSEQQQQQQQMSSNFVTNPAYRVHSLSYESYQSMNHPPIQMSGAYVQNAYPPSNATYDTLAPSPATASQQSEMQATARVFIPNNSRTATPPYPVQIPRHLQWQYQQGIPTVAPPPYPPTQDQFNWHADPTYTFGFGYGMPMQQQQTHGDFRTAMSPSPHPSSWQQQVPQQDLDNVSNRNFTQPHARSASVPTVSEITSPSPHPSIAGSEHSAITTQRTIGGRKESKRKQRSKKKPQKAEVSAVSGTKPAPATKKKGDLSRPTSTTQSVDNEDARVSPSEDPIDAKRLELVESPATRIAFKEFYRSFRGEERMSFQKAEEYARNALHDESLPEAVHWRVYLELADLAKRSNRYVEARLLYQKVCEIQPYASQGWLEYSKLEEECGRMNRVMNILLQGLQYCELSENLLTRAVKHNEKMGNLDGARGLLAKLKHVGIEKVWRTVLEGALLEARAGNVPTARRVLKYLMHHVPWYGPLYLEAYRLEKDQGNTTDALTIVERGLQAIPRYGPLWFGAFRLCEEIDVLQNHFDLPTTMSMIERATKHISKELVWKVHLDASQMLERSALERALEDDPSFRTLLGRAQNRLAMTILTSPVNLRWKVWLAAGRMELELGNTQRARSLFIRAHEVVSEKGRSSTLLECARLEDFAGDTNFARAILCKGRFQYGSDWKVWLESILLEIRVENHQKAIEMCENALTIHHGTGRLWATLVQLRQFYGRDAAQQIALRRALNAVPKSGEVWCEGGRMHLNPFSDMFDLDRARRHLHFATRFTPQYGDGFVETIRLELVRQWLAPIAKYVWDKTKYGFKSGLGGAFEDGLTKYVTDVSLAISIAAQPQKSDSSAQSQKILYKEIVSAVRSQLDPTFLDSKINLNDVRLACINADPNYGLLWFHCRKKATDTPRRIIDDATVIITEELRSYSHLYLAAIVRREAVLSTVALEKPATLSSDTLEVNDPLVVRWEDYTDAKLRAAPSLETIFNPTDPTTGLELLESTARGPLFATGLTKLNKRQSLEDMTLSDRRKALFGIDALFP